MAGCRSHIAFSRARENDVEEGLIQHAAPEWSSSRNGQPSDEWLTALDRIEDLGATEVVSVDDDGFEILARRPDRITLVTDRTAPSSDEAIRLMLAHVQAHWGGRCKLFGDIDFQARAARMAARHGIVVEDLDPSIARILAQETTDVETCDWDVTPADPAVTHF
jgi:hypothetical protein